MKSRRRTNYKFYRVFVFEGTQRVSRNEFPWLEEFLRKYNPDPDDRKRVNDFKAGYLMQLLRLLDEMPLKDRPYYLVITTPTGYPVKAYSRVRSWNTKPGLYEDQDED